MIHGKQLWQIGLLFKAFGTTSDHLELFGANDYHKEHLQPLGSLEVIYAILVIMNMWLQIANYVPSRAIGDQFEPLISVWDS